MKQRKQNQSSYVTYIWVFAVGLTILYAFSLMPRPTGFAAGDTPSECQNYASTDDPYCDDAQEACADKYVEGTSLPACKECTTGQWKQSKWCKGQAAATSTPPAGGTTPPECQNYASTDDPYCDDLQENCADKYVEGTSLVACHECTTGQYKQLKWCKTAATAAGQLEPTKPNFYVSYSELTPNYIKGIYVEKKTGQYGVKNKWTTCSGPLPKTPCKIDFYYEIDSDGNIIKDSKGKDQRIYSFNLILEISNNGKDTTEEFEVKLQKLKPKSDEWETIKSTTLLLLENSLTINVPLHLPTPGSFVNELKNDVNTNKLRFVIDTGNKITESNKNDNEYIIDLPIKKL